MDPKVSALVSWQDIPEPTELLGVIDWDYDDLTKLSSLVSWIPCALKHDWPSGLDKTVWRERAKSWARELGTLHCPDKFKLCAMVSSIYPELIEEFHQGHLESLE